MAARAFEKLSAEELLDAVEVMYLETVEGNATMFRAAMEFARIHNGDAINARDRALPGCERAIRIGGAGTPKVAEFAAAELGARMRMGPVAARHYTADALDVYYRLPRIAALVDAGQVKVSWARQVAKATRHLSKQAAARVDAALAPSLDGRIPYARFCSVLDGEVVAADPETAARREAEAAARQYAKATRGSESGIKGFYLRGPTAWITRFDATVAYLADALAAMGDTDSLDRRRLKACLVMANPMQAVELLAAFAASRAAGVQAETVESSGDPNEAPPHSSESAADQDEELLWDAPLPPDPEDQASDGACSSCGHRPGEVVGDPTAFIRPRAFHPGSLGHQLARLSQLLNCRPPSDAPQPCGPPPNRPPPDRPKPLVPFRFDWDKLLPRPVLYLHMSRAGLDDPAHAVVRSERDGPLTLDYLRSRLLPYARLTVRPVIDLAGQVPVDEYAVPDRHREAVTLRTPSEVFPFGIGRARDSEVDHTRPYAADGPAGQTRLDNLGPLSRFAHRIKTHGRWTVKQPFNGIFVWRDPLGHYYLVDNTGTRKVTEPGGGAEARHPERDAASNSAASPSDLSDVAIDLYPTDLIIEYDGPAHAA